MSTTTPVAPLFQTVSPTGALTSLDFTPSPTVLFLSRSREALGLWLLGGSKVWKLYSTTQQYDTILAALTAADSLGLPVARTHLKKGVVWRREKNPPRSSPGFAVIADALKGTHFTMQHGAGTFVSTITAIRDQETLKRILRACDAARKLGLKDPQGFIDPAARDPIQFIDIHLSSGFANEMHEIVRRRWVGLGGG